jgi:hypothetical protein
MGRRLGARLQPTDGRRHAHLARGNNYYLQRQFAMPPLSLIFDGNGLDPNAAAHQRHPRSSQGRRNFFVRDNASILNSDPAPHAAADQYDALIRTEFHARRQVGTARGKAATS